MYHKENCSSCIRRVCDLESRLIKIHIVVAGQHAFGWSVTLTRNGVSKRLDFPTGRKAALKEYQRLQSQFKKLGDCSLAV